MLEIQPIIALNPISTSGRETYLVLPIIPLSKVLKDTTAFKDPNVLAIRERVCDGGDPSVGIDLQKPRLLLLIGGDVDVLGLVGKAKFFESDGDLDSVGCGVCVERDVGLGCHDGR